MKRILLSYLAAGCSVVAAKAAPNDDIKAAIQGLSTSANYTWTTTNGGGGGRGGFGGPATGMTQKDGLTVVTREFNGNKMSTVSMGDKVVRQNQDGAWMTNEEMMAQFQNGGGNGGGGGRRGRGGFGAMGATTIPARQAADLLAGVKGDFMIINGGFSADLAPESVAPMLTFGRGRRGGGGDGGQAPPAPANAKGTVTFWVTGGVLAKYEIHVTGTVQGRNGDMDVDRTTTTEIKDVGATKLDVPAEALQKLNG